MVYPRSSRIRAIAPQPPRPPAELCASCLEDFSSVRAFDRHRVGCHDVLWSIERKDGRRCLDADEMRAAGMALGARGRWEIAAEAERARERFAA